VSDVGDLEINTVAVNFTVSNARAIDSRKLFALVDEDIASVVM
jgi:hypothetical protein